MNKKIKAIELLNKIANDESYRPTVKYQEMTYTYQWDIGDYTNDFNSEYGIFSGWALNLMLNNEVEILEDNTEEIEELDRNLKLNDLITPYGRNEDLMWTEIIKQHNKIDEIIRYIKRKDKSND